MQNKNGFTLIETLVALALVGILAVAIPSALAVAAKSTVMTHKQTTAESLARSEVDYIQNQPYDSVNNPPVYNLITSLPAGYSLVTPVASRLDPKGTGTGSDEGIQQITVTIKQGTQAIYTLIDYKVNR